jgi:uncharacterized membrane protein YhaH (DUF805 family)
MINVVKHVFRNYATFGGRASRNEFWIFQLFQVLLALVYVLLVVVLVTTGAAGSVGVAESSATTAGVFAIMTSGATIVLTFVYFFVAIATIVPTIAVTARRLHDANISAWWLLIMLAPFGSLALLIMAMLPSYPGVSRFEYEGSGQAPTGFAPKSDNTVTPPSQNELW